MPTDLWVEREERFYTFTLKCGTSKVLLTKALLYMDIVSHYQLAVAQNFSHAHRTIVPNCSQVVNWDGQGETLISLKWLSKPSPRSHFAHTCSTSDIQRTVVKTKILLNFNHRFVPVYLPRPGVQIFKAPNHPPFNGLKCWKFDLLAESPR